MAWSPEDIHELMTLNGPQLATIAMGRLAELAVMAADTDNPQRFDMLSQLIVMVPVMAAKLIQLEDPAGYTDYLTSVAEVMQGTLEFRNWKEQ